MTKANHTLPETLFEQIEAVLRAIKAAKKAAFKAKKVSITLDQWAVIKTISEAEKANQSYLATATHKDPAAITRMVELLIKNELVQRKEVKADKRAYHVKLTRKGAGLVRRLSPVVEKIYADALQDVSDRDLSAVKRISGKIIAGLG
jgi:DNA-binding MarR family transcriptional regulator